MKFFIGPPQEKSVPENIHKFLNEAENPMPGQTGHFHPLSGQSINRISIRSP